MKHLTGYWNNFIKPYWPLHLSFLLLGLFIGIVVTVSNGAVREVQENQLSNRECMLQLIIGGDYSKDPECQYPSKDYDSLRNELASVSSDASKGIEDRARIERKIDCVIALHVQRPGGVVSADEIEGCKASAEMDSSETQESNPTEVQHSTRGDREQPEPQPNSQPDPPPPPPPDSPNRLQQIINFFGNLLP